TFSWDPGTLTRLIQRHQISHLLCVPSLYKTLLENGSREQLASLRVAIVAGESCPTDLVDAHFNQLPTTGLYNEYGPTAATDWCSVSKCEPHSMRVRIPIGKPIANTQLYVLDAQMQPVPVGVPGELHVGGAGVTAGYLNQADLSIQKFAPDTF